MPTPSREQPPLNITKTLEQAVSLHQQDKLAAAAQLYQAVLALQPLDFRALHLLGVLRAQQGNNADAAALIARALSIRPDDGDAWYNRGNVLRALGLHVEALASYDRAVAIRPAFPEALNNRGIVLQGLNRDEDAITCYEQALAIEPGHADALTNRGNALAALHRYAEAVASYDQALAVEPGHAEALNNRGNALRSLDRCDEALASYDQALAVRPDYRDALNNRGNALLALNRYDEAILGYDRVLAGDAIFKGALGAAAHARAHICDWKDHALMTARLVEGVRSLLPVTLPFPFLAVSPSPADQLTCAKTFAGSTYPAVIPALWNGERYHHERIRVAYLSADFHEHATAYLMAGLFERHDRSRFDVTGISLGPEHACDMRSRLVAAFDRFINVRMKSDAEVARLIRDAEVDIAVDLKGYTTGSRPGILVRRPAPIQVNYLGYPGTMGTEHIDYLIADEFVIPQDQQIHYTEKVVYLPGCYQVNDNKRTIAGHVPARMEAGLPERGFVFCCFNNHYKITPQLFDIWMRLLQRVANSVLWLLEGGASTERNLRREAQARGVDPARLVFAPRITLAEHLTRHRLADLFVDTLPYNAHTTASDALWAGLPVVTCAGTTFAGRVAGSLLRASGLPELVTYTLPDYEAMASRLAMQSGLLQAIREKLAATRLTAPLFDTGRSCRHIEAAYTTMWEICQRREPPKAFAVTQEP